MKKLLMIASIALLASFTYIAQHNSIKPFYQLAGTWKQPIRAGYLCERWTKISNNELQGQGFRIIGKDTIWDEKFQLIKKGNDVFYLATVAKQNKGQTIPFKLTSTDNGIYIFSNPQHDYPQQVVYSLPATDTLHAWIDGLVNDKQKRVDFKYVREK